MSFSLEQLTHKNQEFIHIATKQLIADGKTDTEIKEYIEEIYPILLENQAKGITARSLLGSPTAWAKSKTISPEEVTAVAKEENDDPKLMIMDQILLVLGFFAFITGLIGFFSDTARPYGVVTILMFSIMGGLGFYAMYHFFYRHGRSKRPELFKSILLLTAITLVWIAILSLTYLLPASLNPVVPNLPLFIFGALIIALRFYLKKRLNIKNAMRTS